jgi:thioesterase domain-containing protein
MAADYLEEVRRVQATGPYLLGGFSGGGIVAYEMARQLLAAGEKVQQVILLDTPITEPSILSVGDRVQMLWQGLRNGGLAFVRERVQERIAWEQRKRANGDDAAHSPEGGTGTFQSQRIGQAFERAVNRYHLPAVPVNVSLFRPRLDVRFAFRDGRRINADRRYIAEDNLWTPYVAQLDIFEVPGNHDNMVLEPNVRVLVAAIRKSLARAELNAR